MYTQIYKHNMFHNTNTLYNSIQYNIHKDLLPRQFLYYPHGVYTVSYTHLDVYKRQTLQKIRYAQAYVTFKKIM